MRVHRLSTNARVNREVLADFVANLASLPADVISVNFGSLDVEVLSEQMPTCFLPTSTASVFWSRVASADQTSAFLLRHDKGTLEVFTHAETWPCGWRRW